jgi:hypothetical protein
VLDKGAEEAEERTVRMAISVQISPFEPFPAKSCESRGPSCESHLPNPAKVVNHLSHPPESCELMAKLGSANGEVLGGGGWLCSVRVLGPFTLSRSELEPPSIHTSSPETS